MKNILTPFKKGNLTLKNHLVMAPMTRSRAIGNQPSSLMAEYYSQRSGAGLIITEGVAPAPEGLGYPRIPGIFTAEQTLGWKTIVDPVHAEGSKFFLQLMHTGRIGHINNLPEGIELVGVSSVKASGEIWTDQEGMQPFSQPKELSAQDIETVIEAHVSAAKNAIAAGFDGVEIHAANGYLVEQFLNPNVNTRTDNYGGSLEKRSRFVLDLAEAIADAIGNEKLGIRLSPFSTFNDIGLYNPSEVEATYIYLARELERIGAAYLHIGVAAQLDPLFLESIRKAFSNTIILCNGLSPETGEAALGQGFADLVAFGRLYLANPDLDKRIAADAPLNDPDYNTFYTPGSEGYTDYPALS